MVMASAVDEPPWNYHTGSICLRWISNDLGLGAVDLRLSRRPEPDCWYGQLLETWQDEPMGALWFRRIGDASPRQAAYALIRLLQETLAAEASEPDPVPVESLMLWVDEHDRRCVHLRDRQVQVLMALEQAAVTKTYRESTAGSVSRHLHWLT